MHRQCVCRAKGQAL
ncbi:DUF3709 domain-containing protein [Desulfovibrio sp. OttesenSCG-928-F07]|nr:DUF3709 domain-containing protein [Desulfovibrio sp. OttesenSCG-928-F07]